MLTRLLWKLLAPYVAQAIGASLVGFYTQLVAAGLLNMPATPQPSADDPQPGVTHSNLRH